MAAFDWGSVQGIVGDAIQTLGQPAVLSRGSRTFNITLVDGGDVGSDEMGFQERNPAAYSRDAGALAVEKRFRKFTISPTGGVEPRKADGITLATGQTFTIVQIKPVNPAGTALVYDVFAE